MAHIHIKKNHYSLLAGVFAICFICSALLSFVPQPVICEPGAGCDVVTTSPYAYTFGIKNSDYGVIIFPVLFFATLLYQKRPQKRLKQFIYGGVFIGTAYAIYFIYLQAMVIGAYCQYCMTVDVLLICSTAIILYVEYKTWKK